MNFLSQQFTIITYYHMVKHLYNKIGNDSFKGLKNKLPPIRYIGIDDYNNEIVTLAHPNDFCKYIDILKEAYNNNNRENITLDKIKSDIYEIYPSTDTLVNMPNGFIALFVNDIAMKILKEEFNENDEIAKIYFIKITDNGIDLKYINQCHVLNIFLKKFNENNQLIDKYKNLYLVIGQMKIFDLESGETSKIEKYNIIGGKRLYNENSIESTIREASEELGLNKNSSVIYKLINLTIPKTKDIIQCFSFNIYCIYLTIKPKIPLVNVSEI
jgi:hypothetical protein